SADIEGHVKVWDVATGQERSSFRARPHGVFSLAFSADGKRLAHASREMELSQDRGEGRRVVAFRGAPVAVRDLAAGKDVHTFDFPRAGLSRVVLFDGRHLVANVLEGLRFQAKSVSLLKRWDLATGKERELLRTGPGWAIARALRPDGRSALLRIEQRRNGKGLGMGLKLIDLGDGKLTGLAIAPRHTDGTTFTPDSKAVLVAETRRLFAC